MSSNFKVFVAKINNNIIGYLDAEYDKKKNITWIKNVYIVREYRKKGIAKALIQKCIRFFREKTDLFALLTGSRNLIIFEKLGFSKTMNYMIKERK